MSVQTIHDKASPWQDRLGAAWKQLRPSLGILAKDVFGQLRVWRKAYPGVMHALIFWGVTVQVLGTAINLMQMQLFIPFVELPFPRGAWYLAYELIMDSAGVAILLGVGMAALRRALLRPKTLQTRPEDAYALALLALIPLAGFTTESLRLRAAAPAWAGWSPVGNLLAGLWGALGLSPQAAAILHPFLFWSHAALGLALLASIPFTKLRHLVQTPLNILLRPRRHPAELAKIENIEETELLGVGQVAEFTPSQLLSFDACLRCGRCEEVCPAVQAGMHYSPKDFIQSLREARVAALERPNGGAHALLGEVFSPELPWNCTTCGACLSLCPAYVNPVDEIIDLRRYQALTSGQIPKTVADTFRNLERQGNPWGLPPEERLTWTEGLSLRELAPGDKTDVLFFTGCALAFDQRNRKVARALVRLFEHAGLDFGILGLDEFCCGDTARRLGHEYLFQMLAEQNVAALGQIEFKRIVTQCPHCYNSLKNEYPQMDGRYQVLHYTELLAGLELDLPAIAGGANGAAGYTYHDSCYLGRYNGVMSQPRVLLEQAGIDIQEMRHTRQDALCCGGGGGGMWLESEGETRINHLRLKEALATGVGAVATACPYCLLMFDDAIRTQGVGEQFQVLDISEILAARL